jgi:hypothetical protein
VAKFRNITDDDLHVGSTEGRVIDPDGLTETPGVVLEEIGDAWIVGRRLGDDHGNPIGDPDARAWPKSTWDLVDPGSEGDD